MSDAAAFLSIFANEKRLAIMSILLRGEISVGSLAHRLNLTQSALSQHLAKMREQGIVNTRRHRQTIYYSSDNVAARDLLKLVEAWTPESANG